MKVTYEAGPTGFGLARFLRGRGLGCLMAAPSKLQRPWGDRVKTDARDAELLARLTSAGGVETRRVALVQPLIDDGHQVAITLTPTAAVWLDHLGERQRLEDLTGLPVRSTPRLPDEPKPHPRAMSSWARQ